MSQNHVNENKECIKDFFDLKSNNLVSKPEWGDLNFKDIENILNIIEEHLEDINSLPIEKLPTRDLDNLVETLQSLIKFCAQINVFKVSQENATIIRDKLKNNFLGAATNFLNFITSIMGFLHFYRDKIAEKDWNKKFAKITKVVEASEEKGEELNKILEGARQASVETGTAGFSGAFEKEAKKLKWISRTWLGLTVILVIITYFVISTIWEEVKSIPQDFFTEQNYLFKAIQFTILRVIILSLPISGMWWCARQYKVLSHLATLSRHRALSLNTLNAFLNATEDPEIKNAILLEVSRAVFQAGQTGFLEGHDNPPTTFSHIREISKNIKDS